MKHLFKISLVMVAFFTFTLILARLSGFFSFDQMKLWLEAFQNSHPIIIGSIISFFLFIDLFIAVPTMSLCILSGYFLGFQMGSIFSLAGTYLAGITGHFLSKKYGMLVLNKIIKKESERQELISTFHQYGFSMILMSRVAPALPEVTACLSGITSMSFKKFFLAWFISTTPYVLLTSYSGSISSIENPSPAIYVVVGLTSFFAISWLFLKKRIRRQKIKK